MSGYAHQKIDNPAPASGDKVYTYSASLSAWVLTSLTQLMTWLLAAIPIAWGTWTPTATTETNMDSVTWSAGWYVRVGTVAIGFGTLAADRCRDRILERRPDSGGQQ